MPDRKYEMYMQSPRWQMVRQTRFALDNYKCVCCGRPMDLECHHLTYMHFMHENIFHDLVTLCKYCHKEIEALKKTTTWGPYQQFIFLFIQKFKSKDIAFGGSENLCKPETIRKYWTILHQDLHWDMHRGLRIDRIVEIRDYFGQMKAARIKAEKERGAPADYLRSKGFSEHMISKYYYSKEDK